MSYTQWYKITDLNQLPFADKFVELDEDDETKNFLFKCFEKSENFLMQLLHSFIMSILRFFMSITSINGLLHRGSMFVFSIQQFRFLIDFDSHYGGHKLNSLLDLGAGDGMVTSRMAPFFKNVYATEMSGPMRWRLRQKGYTILDVNEWHKQQNARTNSSLAEAESHLKYDAISCLNLLDRCESPITLLKNVRESLVDNGLLIVAIVLPFKPYVEYNRDNRPKEDLLSLMNLMEQKSDNNQFAADRWHTTSTYPTQSSLPSFIPSSSSSNKNNNNNNESSFSCDKPVKHQNRVINQINFLVDGLFRPAGFTLVKFTRLPYLCEGNLSQSYFYMFDYVFILRKS